MNPTDYSIGSVALNPHYGSFPPRSARTFFSFIALFCIVGCNGVETVDNSHPSPKPEFVSEQYLERYDIVIRVTPMLDGRLQIDDAAVQRDDAKQSINKRRGLSSRTAVVYKMTGKREVPYESPRELLENICRQLMLDLFMDEPVSRNDRSGGKELVCLVKQE